MTSTLSVGDPLVYDLRSAFATGNLNPSSKHLDLLNFLKSLFFTDKPYHVFVVPESRIQHFYALIAAKRGISPFIYNSLYHEDHIDSNFRANESSFFFGSFNMPHIPYIMLTSTISEVAFLYFRKFGMTIFAEKGYPVPYFDYEFEYDWQVGELITRSIYISSNLIGDLSIDLLVSPRVSDFIKVIYEMKQKLTSKLHANVSVFQYLTDLNLSQDELDLPFGVVQMDGSYYLSYFDVDQMIAIDENEKLIKKQEKVEYPRSFIVSPSGSGKTYFIKSHVVVNPSDNLLVDADSIFEWPSVHRWWEDPELTQRVNDRNRDLLIQWLDGPKDGRIIFYADTLGLHPDAIVLIPEEIHKSHLKSKENKDQPGLKDWEWIKKGRTELLLVNAPKFENFSSAVGKILAQGRHQIQRMNRYAWRVFFKVEKRFLPDYKIQTCFSSQTWLVKSLTYALSRLLLLGSGDMEVPRRLALKELKCYYINSIRVGGFTKVRGKIVPLAVSGHMVNYVMLSNFIPLDWGRLFQQVEWNLELFSTNRKLTHLEKKYAIEGKLAERQNIQNIRRLWHNVPEWYAGIIAGRIFSNYIGFVPDVEEKKLFIQSLAIKYPKGLVKSATVIDAEAEGFTKTEWISSKDERKLANWSFGD